MLQKVLALKNSHNNNILVYDDFTAIWVVYVIKYQEKVYIFHFQLWQDTRKATVHAL